MGSGQFNQKGDKSVSGLGEGEWRLRGDEGNREFTMREWEDKERRGRITREGGEWDLRSGGKCREGGLISAESDHEGVTKEEEQPIGEDSADSICCD